jgi:hypothetical protein
MHAVAQLVEALFYQSKGRGFDSRWCHWHFIGITLPALRSTSASNRNECQEYFLGGKGGWCVGLIKLPPSCADFLELWEPRPRGNSWVCKNPEQGFLY